MTLVMATACVNSMWTPEHCSEIIRAGADLFRISSAYGAPRQHVGLLRDLRVAAMNNGKEVRIAYDLNNGTKLRILGDDSVALRQGDRFSIGTRPDPKRLSLDRELQATLAPGERLYFGDADLVASVDRHDGAAIHCIAEVDGFLRPGKAMTSAKRDLGLGPINVLNEDLLGLAADTGFDCVLLSFVRSESDVFRARDALDSNGGASVRIVSKIETREAMTNVASIVTASDAVMVARGDLAIQLGFAELPTAQWRIARAAAAQHCPWIVATQAFESALTRPRPSAADVLNIGEAVAMGAAAVMLGPETCANPKGVALVGAVTEVIEATRLAEIELSVRESGLW